MKTTSYLSILLLSIFLHTHLSAQIVNIEERRISGTNDSTYWYGTLRLGANMVKVKEEVVRFKGTGQIQYKKGRSMTLLLADGNFLRAGNKDFNKKLFGHLRFNYKLGETLTSEAFVQGQYNKLLLLRLRALVGTGLRFRFLKSMDGQQRVYGGMAYIYEANRFLEEIPDRNWHRLSTYVSFTFHPWEGVKLINTTYFQPVLSDFGNYRFATEWRLDTPLGKKMTFFTDFSMSIDQSLPVGAPTNTYAWLNGVAVKF